MFSDCWCFICVSMGLTRLLDCCWRLVVRYFVTLCCMAGRGFLTVGVISVVLFNTLGVVGLFLLC